MTTKKDNDESSYVNINHKVNIHINLRNSEKINCLGTLVNFSENKNTTQDLYNYSQRNISEIVDSDLQKEAGGLTFFAMFLGST